MTWHTSVGRIEVRSKVRRTRSGSDERRIRHTELARVEARARRVQVRQHVNGTTKMTIVLGDTAADLHSPEHR